MLHLLGYVLQAFILVLLVYMVLSWFPSGNTVNYLRRVCGAVVEPVVAPVRRVVQPVRVGGVGLDLSVTLVFIVCLLLRGLLV